MFEVQRDGRLGSRLNGFHAALAVALVTSACVTGTRIKTGGQGTKDPPLEVADSVRGVLLMAGHELLTQVLAATRDTAAVCVSFARGTERFRGDPSDLRALAIDPRTIVNRTDCPPTYASMIAFV